MISGIRTTCYLNTKIIYPDSQKPHLWCSDALEEYGFDESKTNFFADSVDFELSEDGKSFTLKSARNEDCLVNLKISQASPGFKAGENGKTCFGTDTENPWGWMYHVFWPRCTVEGGMVTKDGDVSFNGRGMFIQALQGMKPHHAGNIYASDNTIIITLLIISSGEMEFHELPITYVLRRHDGVHHASILRLFGCECRRYRD